jgi:hypothetical protein
MLKHHGKQKAKMLHYRSCWHRHSIVPIHSELRRHSWDNFVDDPPAIAQGGKGVGVAGCPACRERLYTVSQFVEHLAKDVIPKVIRRQASSSSAQTI